MLSPDVKHHLSAAVRQRRGITQIYFGLPPTNTPSHITLKVFQSHMTCWKASVLWTTFPFVCVKLHTHTHTHSKTPKSNNSVDINKGAIIMNVIHSAEGKEKMSKDLLSLKLCAEAHVLIFHSSGSNVTIVCSLGHFTSDDFKRLVPLKQHFFV